MPAQANPKLAYNFGTQGCGTCGWYVVVDQVMGGRSTAVFEPGETSATLSGNVSLENNGGFASIRTPFAEFDLSGFKTVTIRYRSSGQAFAMSLNNYRRYYEPKFKHSLPATQNEWATLTIPLGDFYKVRLNEKLGSAPTQQELANMIRLGLITDEKVATDFYLELDFIEFI